MGCSQMQERCCTSPKVSCAHLPCLLGLGGQASCKGRSPVTILSAIAPATTCACCADGSPQALLVALHMQLAALESASLSPLVLPPDVVQWFEEQLETARAAPVPLLPQATNLAATQQQQQQQQLQVGSPSLRQKRKWQASSPPHATAAAGQPLAPRSWAAVVSGVPADHAASSAQRLPAISRLPYWQQLQEQLQAEKQQSFGLRDHAALAASGAAAVGTHVAQPPEAAGGAGSPTLAAAASQSPLLQALRQQAASERAATQRLLHLVQ